MDPTERIELWLKDMQLKGLYPRPLSVTIQTTNTKLEASKTPILPPLRVAAPTWVQSRASKDNENKDDEKDMGLVVCSVVKHKT